MYSLKSVWLYLFFIAAAINLIAEVIHNQTLTYISKPLLMIFLGVHFWQHRTPNRFTNLILIGLFFAFVGDTLLMFRTGEAGQTHFFLLGLGSFLITQLCYFLAFWGYAKGNGYLKKHPWILFFFLLYLMGNMLLLWEGLPMAFRLPVLGYSSVITLMAVSCTNLFQLIPNPIFRYLFIGVLLFVLSDTLIGLSTFKAVIPLAGLFIMSTYIVAQFLIVQGSLLLDK